MNKEVERLEAIERGDLIDDIVGHQSIGDLKNSTLVEWFKIWSEEVLVWKPEILVRELTPVMSS